MHYVYREQSCGCDSGNELHSEKMSMRETEKTNGTASESDERYCRYKK